MKRIIDKKTMLFLRDDTQWNDELEIALEVEPDNESALVHPKWDGEKWVEGANEIPQVQKVNQTPTIEERVQLLEEVVLGGKK